MHYTLLQLNQLIESTLAQVFYGKTFIVLAETSEIKKSGNGHYYFDLIEKDGQTLLAKMHAVIWKSASPVITNFENTTGQKFERNLKLMLKAEVRFHTAYGLQLQVVDIDTSYTLGQIALQTQATLQLLVKNNAQHITLADGQYFTTNNKLQPKGLLKRIALITAVNSDGCNDFLHEINNNVYGYSYNVTTCYALVQGNEAATQVKQQLHYILINHKQFDAVALVRGGGSQTDFNAFDDYDLCAAVAAFPLPIIAGIGHERNVSICDLMCYKSVKTPTKAAAFFVDFHLHAEQQLDNMYNRFIANLDRNLINRNNNLENLEQDLIFYAQNVIDRQQHLHDKFEIALKHLNPEKVLQRGYAIIKKNNSIITESTKLMPRDLVQIQLKDGIKEANITH
ncbi:MAG: exodeoxyribonuclease VII large subunit [Bacteroidia bacterium]|nr:exodeoxyribonuclease VII large subunit [Bacteroidia bacterium]